MKRAFALLFALWLALPALLLPALATEDVSGVYAATSCKQDGTRYQCDGEWLLLYADGSGLLRFNDQNYAIQWTLEGDSFTFVDQDGDSMDDGQLSGGVIRGTYLDYSYTYELTDIPPAEVDPQGGQPSQPPVEPAEEPGGNANYTITFYATSCMQGGEKYTTKGEYFILNEDGSGMVVYNKCAYGLSWTLDGERLTFTDSRGKKLAGTVSGDTIKAQYNGYDYVFELGEDAPILSLSPNTWQNGLPPMADQAGILSADQAAELQAEMDRISRQYNCNVYIVTLDDMNDFSLSESVETCAEEVRTGYSLGYGQDKDCILLLMSMAERDFDLCAFGDFGSATFSELGRDALQEKFLDNFKEDDWYGGFADYVNGCEKLLELSAAGTPLDYDTAPVSKTAAAVLAFIPALLIGFIAAMVIRSSMKSVAEQSEAREYVTGNGAVISHRSDRFSYASESRVYDPPEKSSGGGSSSSGHSHSSGKF